MAGHRPGPIGKGKEYCQRRQSELKADQTLGFGVHGTVFACARHGFPARTAVKVHDRSEPYYRERDAYLRLRDRHIESIQGHNVPQLIDYDDELWVVEMTIVVRPFVLGFGMAYLDHPRAFEAELLVQWRREKEEQFEENWPKAASILAELRRYGIHVADVNPGDIGFLERTTHDDYSPNDEPSPGRLCLMATRSNRVVSAPSLGFAQPPSPLGKGPGVRGIAIRSAE